MDLGPSKQFRDVMDTKKNCKKAPQNCIKPQRRNSKHLFTNILTYDTRKFQRLKQHKRSSELPEKCQVKSFALYYFPRRFTVIFKCSKDAVHNRKTIFTLKVKRKRNMETLELFIIKKIKTSIF